VTDHPVEPPERPTERLDKELRKFVERWGQYQRQNVRNPDLIDAYLDAHPDFAVANREWDSPRREHGNG
jgi:hypothetical protein